MADRNRLTVQIANKEYTLVSEDSREYMLEVSDYVDHQMKKISGMSPCMSTAMVAVLTAINIADDYFKNKQKLDESAKKIIEYTKKVEELEAELDRLRSKPDAAHSRQPDKAHS